MQQRLTLFIGRCQEEWNFSTSKISGKVYHRIGSGSQLPHPDRVPQYLQLYFVDNEENEALYKCRNTDSETLNMDSVINLQKNVTRG